MNNQRFLSLDVFRGMTVCFMIIVNSPGSWNDVYSFLLHAPWHGFRATDLVFPSFLFAVGNALAFTINRTEKSDTQKFWTKTLRRFALIFLIGFLLNWFSFVDFSSGSMISLDTLRIMGVLQRIALCYLFASIIIYNGSKHVTILIGIALLLGYWALLYFIGSNVDPYSITGYAGNAIDFFVLGKNHLYTGEGIPFDPEGLLSTLPAIANVLGGYLVGDFIRKHGATQTTVKQLMFVATAMILIALLWHGLFPINKKIWTSSFVLLTTGLDILLLSVLIAVIEMKKSERWGYFFVVFGRNPLSIYVLSNILLVALYTIPMTAGSLQTWMYDRLRTITSPMNASLLFALFFMLLCWAIGYWMDRKKVYIRV
jgi:predicted acyltransferase